MFAEFQQAKTLKMKVIYSILILFLGIQFSSAQQDSVLQELQSIKETNTLLKIKDSIRTEILKEGLGNIVSPSSKELEKYKNELKKIKQEDSLRLVQQKISIEKLRKKVKPYPVLLLHQKLFDVYSGLGPFSTKDRALDAEGNIEELYRQKVYFKDSLKIQRNQEYLNIMYNGEVITSVSQEDALWENVSQDSLANRYLKVIANTVDETRSSHQLENIALRWLMTLGIVVAFFVMLKLSRRLFRFLIRKTVEKTTSQNPERLKVKNYEILSPRKLRMVMVRVLKWAHILVFFVLLSLAVSLIFSIFPSTEHYAYRFLHFVIVPLKEVFHSVVNYFPNLLRIIVFLIIGRYIDQLLRYFSIEIQRGNLKINGFHIDWAKPTYNLLRICLIAFVVIMVFPYLPGSDTSAFRGISVFFGVLLSLGSSSAIANTVAGFIITYMRPFQVGDWIKVNNMIGEVIEKTALVTRLRTINNEDITVPNSMILTNETINYSSSSPENGLILNAEIDVKYNVPFTKVNDLMIQAALQTEGIVAMPKPYVFKSNLKDTSVRYQLNAYTMNPEKMYFIKSDLNENILKVFGEADVDLVAPMYFAPDRKS